MVTVEFEKKTDNDWIELFPYGVTLGVDEVRPVMIFKDENEKHVLPVWVSELEAQIAMDQTSGDRFVGSPHTIAINILKELNAKIDRCVFVELKGHHQVVEVFYTANGEEKKVKARAHEIMSFLLSSKPQFFCTLKHIKNSQKIEFEMESTRSKMAVESIRGRNILASKGRYLN